MCVVRFESAEAILEAFVPLRLHYYDLRKQRLAAQLSAALLTLENKTRFVLMVIDGTLVLFRKKKADLVLELQTLGFAMEDGG